MIDVSVIVVNYNTGEYLANCLGSLATPGPEVEVIVVDNRSVDGSLEAARRAFPRHEYIRLGSNVGFGAANNVALSRATGRYVLFLNPDTLVMSGAVERLVAFLDRTPDAGGCGGKLLNRDGSVQHDYRYRYGHTTLWVNILANCGLLGLLERAGVVHNDLAGSRYYEDIRQVRALHGAFFMVRRTVAVELGGFDERFFMYGESEDFTHRFRKAGWGTYYVPDARVVHFGQVSTRQVPVEMMVASVKSGVLYHTKHGGWFAACVYRLGMLLKYCLRTVRLAVTGDTEAGKLDSHLALVRWLALQWRV